ncbi:MAG TPA: hypothetical protein VMU83_02745 [Hanamia sp.]|nr:hypothetical protein [Hanamia sp.]
MKQAKNKTGNIALALFALCTMGLSVPSFAGIKTGNPIELKFIGKENSQPIFQLKLNNSENGLYLISIKDASQNVLFSEKVKGIDIVRTYRMDIDPDDYESPSFGLKFEVTNLNTHQTQEYKVSSETHVTNNIIVAKL